MPCPSCSHANPEGSRFCLECGHALGVSCGGCGAELPAGAKFCNQCGAAAGAATTSPATAPPPARERSPLDYTPKHLAERILQSKSALEGERKQVTVLFADVKGSMELAEQVDAEAWHAILDRFFQILSDGVHRFEGTVNQYTGDGIMALFGAPIAHEDHVQRACYAALQLRDELRAYSDELRLSRGLDFSVRMGIHSGEVVVGKIGDDLRMDYTAQGHTVGLAQRMEQLAAAHSICMTETTAGRAEGYFDVRDLGEAAIKGVAEPVHVFELLGVGEQRTRFDVSRSRGLTRFVGRDADMKVLEQALEQAREGNGQVVGVVAEAGTGKSRLCFEFTERCRALGLRVMQGSGVPHGKNIPLLPILQVFRAYFGIEEEDDDRSAREKIAGRLLLIDETFRDSLPVVFDFMGVPDSERPAPAIDEEARERQVVGVMRKLVETGAENDATVTLIEDLHWVDPGTDTWLEEMVEVAAGSQTLLLVNFRPEYHAGWMQKSYYRQLPLLPLGPEAVHELLADMLGDDSSIADLAEAVHARTEGNPFFTEEVVQALIEAGNLEGTKGAYRLVTPIERLTVPSTVQSVLAARIDRLGEREKQVLQAASVIGTEFPEPILEAVAELPTSDLSASLQSLKDGEFIFQQSLYPVSEFAFKHPLTQEVALGSQLAERRKRVHAEVARAIQAQEPDRLDEHSALLAHHFEQAEETLEAVRWHGRAGEWMKGRNGAALVGHWKKAHVLAKTLPATREAMELTLRACDRILSSGWRTGLSEEEWEQLAAEGATLAERLSDRHGLFGVTLGLATIRMICGYLDDAREPVERAIALAEEIGDLDDRVESRNILLGILWNSGRFEEFHKVYDETEKLVAGDNSIGVQRYNVSLANWLPAQLGAVSAWKGRLGEAAELLERSDQGARDLGQTEVSGWAQHNLSRVRALAGAGEQALMHGQRALELSEQAASTIGETLAYSSIGHAQLLRGEPEAARESLERALTTSRERRVGRAEMALMYAPLGDAHLALGDPDTAREVAEEGVDFATRSGCLIYLLACELARARALRALDVSAHAEELAGLLDRCEARAAELEAGVFPPFIHEERARLRGALGDADALRTGLERARQGFVAIGANGHAARLEAEGA
jgi:class 3 adenylate cyclase/tetratricopeptide (TPR) repeat protein